jgi:colanic acid biosynthesis glycosyl transferase WcaI
VRIRIYNTFEPVTSFYRDLLPFLAEQGVKVQVVASSAEYRIGRARLKEWLCHPNIQVRFIPAGIDSTTSRSRKAWIMLTYIIGAVLCTLFGRPTDLNFYLTQPPLFSIWGYVLKILRRQPYCCLVMDIYPDLAVQEGMLAPASPLTRLLISISRLAWRQAAQVIVIGRCMQAYLAQAGVPPERIHVIPNWANETEVYPVPDAHNQLRQELGVEDCFVVLYSGNIGVSHYFDDLLAVARQLRQVSKLKFVFIGDGVRRREIEAAQQSNQLDNIILLPFQPTARLPHSLSLGNLHFVSLRSGFEGLVVPSKTYGVLAAGRPLIYQGNLQSEIAQMISEEGVGAAIPCGDVDGLQQTVLRYLDDPHLCRAQGQKALALSRGRYSRQQALRRYAHALGLRESIPTRYEALEEGVWPGSTGP